MSARTRVLIIDDDMKFCRLIADYLNGFGYDTFASHRGFEAVDRACNEDWNAIILDVMLPGLNGFEIVKRLRDRSNNTPILMLTALGDEADRIVGLELGADDYLAKTSSPRELLARLRAVLRRTSLHEDTRDNSSASEILVGPLSINTGARLVMIDNVEVPLTPVEYDLLLVLAQSKGRVKTRSDLLNEIRDRNYDVSDRSIDVHVSSLRRKLDDDPKSPRLIKTVRSAGYMLVSPSEKTK